MGTGLPCCRMVPGAIFNQFSAVRNLCQICPQYMWSDSARTGRVASVEILKGTVQEAFSSGGEAKLKLFFEENAHDMPMDTHPASQQLFKLVWQDVQGLVKAASEAPQEGAAPSAPPKAVPKLSLTKVLEVVHKHLDCVMGDAEIGLAKAIQTVALSTGFVPSVAAVIFAGTDEIASYLGLRAGYAFFVLEKVLCGARRVSEKDWHVEITLMSEYTDDIAEVGARP